MQLLHFSKTGLVFPRRARPAEQPEEGVRATVVTQRARSNAVISTVCLGLWGKVLHAHLCSSNHSGERCVLHDPAILQGGRGDRVGRATVPCQCQRGAAGWDCRMDDDHWVWVSSWSLCCPLLPLWHTDRSLSG